MIIREIFYKDIPALELTTSAVRAIVVPQQGGKTVSFQGIDSNKEYLLQNPSERFLRMGLQDEFVNCECAGFDDMFPTIDPVSITCADGITLSYPDHGEVCRLSFEAEISKNALTLRTFPMHWATFTKKTSPRTRTGACGSATASRTVHRTTWTCYGRDISF